MSHSNRLLYVSLGGCLALLWASEGSSQGDVPKRLPVVEKSQRITSESPAPKGLAPKQSGKTDQATPETLPPLPIKKPGASKPVCDARCKAAENRQKADLIAQQSMADGTTDLVDLTFWQSVIGFLGLVALFYTLFLTRQSNKAAIKAATAAENSVLVASDTAELQLRAYVLLENASVTNLAAGNLPNIAIKIKNFGQTPASDFHHWAVVGFQPFPLDGELPKSDKSIPTTRAVIPPGGDVEGTISYNRFMTDSDIEGIQKGEVGLYLFGFITYTDAFGKPRETQYCTFVGGPVGKRDYMATYSEGNHYT
jgi:hypothetical protein